MFANRLRKNLKRLQKWRQQSEVECYRLYDADMPEYAVAIDVYGDYLHIAEYAAPKSVSEEDATRRFNEVVEACQVVFNVSDRAEFGLSAASDSAASGSTSGYLSGVNVIKSKSWVLACG